MLLLNLTGQIVISVLANRRLKTYNVTMFRLKLEQKKILKTIGQDFGLKFIVVFGSYAVGTENEESDLDIAIYFKEEAKGDPKTFGRIIFGLQKVFRGKDVDLSFLNNANPLFRYEVAMSGKLLYGNEIAFLEFKAFAYRDFMDSRSLHDLESTLIEKRQKLLRKTYG